VLLQEYRHPRPHANEPAGAAAAFAAGDSYTGVEMLIASPFDDYVFGSATRGMRRPLGRQ